MSDGKRHEGRTADGGMVPLAITGIGALFPEAEGLDRYWANIREGVDCIRDVPASHWKAEDYFDEDPRSPDRTYARRGGFLPAARFNPMEFGVSPNALEATDSAQLLGLLVARRALDDAGYGDGGRELDRDRASVLLGVTGTLQLVIPLGARLGHPIWRRALRDAGVDPETAADVVARISDEYVGWKEDSFPGLLGNVVAGRIANRLDLHGTNCVVDAACASSLGALHLAMMELASGRSDVVVTGGVDTFNDIFMYMCFSKTPALSKTGDARPFDADADGTILGEGLGMFVVKRLADAERDGDRVYAVIRGIGTASDGRGDAVYAPSAEGQARCLRAAYRDAGVSPDTVELVEAHGTGTKVGDAIELRALTDVFREARSEGAWCQLGTVKSQIGHTKAAAGAAGLIKAALALHHRVLPPSLKVRRPQDALLAGETPFTLSLTKRPWMPREEHPRRAGVSSFGFGGSNFHVVLEEYGDRAPAADWDGDVQVVPFAATDRAKLAAAVAGWPREGAWEDVRARAAAARKAFDPAADCRLAVVLERSGTPVARVLDGAVAMLEKYPERATWSTPDGAHFACGEVPGRLGVLFPGQGSQSVGMLRDLACRFPEMQDAVAEADRAFAGAAGDDRRLSDLIWPPTAWTDEQADAQEAALRDTQVAQPAIGAVSLGALRVLEGFGLEPDAVAGHSYGELLALCAAGRYGPDALHHLSGLRGRLMAGGARDQGSMLAVQAPLADVEAVLEEEELDLVLANRNTPTQAVLSGATAEIERAEQVFTARSLRVKRLSVSAAFHSSLVAHAREPMRAALDEVDLAPARIPVFSNGTAEEYPADPDAARELLANQLAMPVEFVRIVENMHAAGVRTFVEVGPGARIGALVGSILGDRPHAVVSLDASNGRRDGVADLAGVLARLAVLGHGVDLRRWDPDAPASSTASGDGRPVWTVDLTGANYRKASAPRPPRSPRPVATSTPAPAAPPPLPAPAAAVPPPTLPPLPAGAPVRDAALAAAQANMDALRQVQEQTVEMHRRFLEHQDQVRRTLEGLLDRQMTALGVAVPGRSVPSSAPAPIASNPAPAPVPAPPPPAPAPAPAVEGVGAALLECVAEKTGYPAEMLSLDMGMDADLGIDSIKRVEILSAMQERVPGLPAVPPDRMGALRTLQDVLDLLAELGGGAVPASPAVAAPPSSVAPATPAPAAGGVAAALLECVAEKTGYPAEMLSLDMGMDADLGIDSIKRVEILSAMQERVPGLPAVPPDRMGALRTLQDVLDLLAELGGPAPAPAPAKAPAGGPDVAAVLLGCVAEKTGYPAEMLSLDMGMDADLGIDSIKRVEILSAMQERVPGLPAVPPDRMGALRTLQDVLDLLDDLGGESPAAAPVAAVPAPVVPAAPPAALQRSVVVASPWTPPADRAATVLPGGSTVWITADGDGLADALAAAFTERGFAARVVPPAGPSDGVPAALGGLVLVGARRGGDAEWLGDLFELVRLAAPSLRRAGEEGGALLATLTRMDGACGLRAGAPAGDRAAGLAGLAKSAAHEWPEVTARAVDVDPADAVALAGAVADELLRDGPREIGLSAGGVVVPEERVEALAADDHEPPRLGAGDLVVVSGGARGVTAACALALARRFRPALLLLGRSPSPRPEPEWLRSLHAEAEVKRALAERAGDGASPREIEAAWRDARANREIAATLAALEAAGAQVLYRSVDVRDGEAVAAAVAEARAAHGSVRALVHGAGVLADARLEDKDREGVDRVVGTKVDGLRALLGAVGDDDLRVLLGFSSTTARVGRRGQSDYAVANEALNKALRAEAGRRPGCRVRSLGWGPWDGGMVTPGLAKLFAAEGVPLIPEDLGAAHLVREATAAAGADGPVEVVLLGPAPSGGGGAVPATPAKPAVPADPEAMTTAFERPIDVERYGFLRSHVLDGRAVWPAAMTLEWLAHGALHGNPGLSFHGVDDLRVLKGVVLDGPSRTLRVRAGRAVKDGRLRRVPVEMLGRGDDGREVLHARAHVVLVPQLPAPPEPGPIPPTHPWELDAEGIYRDLLFHGPDMQAIERVTGSAEEGIVLHARRSPPPRDWIARPLRGGWIADPLALDAAFQALILWSLEHRGAGSLPTTLGSYRQYRRVFPPDGVRLVVRIKSVREHAARADIDFLDASDELVARLDGYECVIDASLRRAFRHRTLGDRPDDRTAG